MRVIEFEGRRIEVPPDFTDEDVSRILASPPTAQITVNPQSAAPPPGPGVGASPAADQALRDAPAPSQTVRAGVQGAGRGLAELAGMPFDLSNAAANILLTGADKTSQFFGGPEMPFRFGSVSDKLAQGASDVAGMFGVETMDPAQMNRPERVSYNVNRFGAQAAPTAGLLATAAVPRAAQVAAGSTPRVGDPLLRPYFGENVGRTLTGDAAAAAGAGGAISAVQDPAMPKAVQDSPLAHFLASLAGGAAGVTGAETVRATAGAAKRAAGAPVGLNIERNINADPFTGAPVTKRAADVAAESVRNEAADAPTAAAFLRANQPQMAGLTDGPTPLQMTEDPGLARLDKMIGQRQGGQELARQQRVQSSIRDKVDEAVPPGAKPDALQSFGTTREADLIATRDAEALPLLQKAEASNVTVDSIPVAALIENKLTEVKRPPVKNGLTEARKLLNKPGSDELDTSVRGLYESRKAINDVIEGRGDNPTGRFAQRELLDVRDALDAALVKASPEFGEYLTKYRAGSEPLNKLRDSDAMTLATKADADKAVHAVMSQPHRSGRLLNELIDLTDGNPDARNGLKAAVHSYIVDKATTTATEKMRPGDKRGPVSGAKLTDIFSEHERELSRIFNPDEMNGLRVGHKALKLIDVERLRVGTGSDTAEKIQVIDQWLKTPLGKGLDAALRLKFGMLRGGGMVAILRRQMAGVTSAVADDAARLVERSRQDPDLLLLLLGRKVPVASPAWNAKLNKYLAAAEGAREMTDGD
jgi:hypothetical protein